ncbi:MAG: carboxypeptidase regulatory-like domain-containing protein [Myxococcales bacterium]|nr:carboxypeptidase regulatory-like domain-containing protein [Myxococcales bacterium]
MLALFLSLSGCVSGSRSIPADVPVPTPPVEPVPPVVDPPEEPAPSTLGDLYGTACIGGVAVQGARVRLEHAQGVVELTTDAAGAFEARDLPAGPVSVEVRMGSVAAAVQATVVAGEAREAGVPCFDAAPESVLVIEGDYDDVGASLSAMGVVYDSVLPQAGVPPFPPFPVAMYDLVIVGSGAQLSPDWVAGLRDAAGAGATVYATDYACEVVEEAFPQAIDFLGDDTDLGQAMRGVEQTVVATAAGALAAVGPTVQVELTIGEWPVMEAVSGTVLLEAQVEYYEAPTNAPFSAVRPLLVSAPVGPGTVVYASFLHQDQGFGDAVLTYLLTL